MLRAAAASALLALVPWPVAGVEEEGVAARAVVPVFDAGVVVEMLIGLALVVGLILALGWLVRRFGSLPGGGKGVVKVLGGVSLGARERVVLLEVEKTRLLVGVAPGRVQTLHVLEGTGSVPDSEAFSAHLEAQCREREQ
ncbi:MAG: flagellar biosynthetic protein FliO [Candidatus Sedimenticola endophacoides]|uniref:Flagellar protein n=1 Tax=Candidatus Sedimenticola endophacoides TaxID=2548426 RepID=A0A657PJI2_9GAMM|nr:MAG: flagellar biosynthetic protein FliO [Candidatus Sedimenticola endophacoides]OQX33608.1 MAG: flagellar biosynthetic protein FliO [Candidatus Sedimenticola endophacoides]OQX34023.1 MAG: flagellar biosynthetic protein FliO [Candidatus Sedimenticola endophacoides]OQX38770.1 MAG: flagellar biosynthetic protein FliO [Candidatus Sedimenticola endophacoides]OQX45425.1 MAG: flagellar biosynthetic protein FliO [Candidatus Sedimenticola endophacoides]